MRWATDEKLSAGTERVRLGTDRRRYGSAEPVRVRAKLIGRDYAPVRADDIAVKLFRMNGDEATLVARKSMRPEEGTAAIYEADMGALPPGRYRAEVDSPAVRELLAGEGAARGTGVPPVKKAERQGQDAPETHGRDAHATRRGVVESVATEFAVDAGTPRELIELTPDRGLLGRLAGMTGGMVLEPQNAAVALDRLAKPSEVLAERRQVTLWNSWPLLLLIVAAATAEWLIRRKEALP
jgi:hypothetical protein